MALGLFVVGIVKYFLGSKDNETVAMLWRKSCTPVFRQEFEHVGCNSEQQSLAMMQRSYSEFEYFASGRKNMYWADVKLSLCRRHCLFMSLPMDVMKGVTAKVEGGVPIQPANCISPREHVIYYRKDTKAKQNTHEQLCHIHNNTNDTPRRMSDMEREGSNAGMR